MRERRRIARRPAAALTVAVLLAAVLCGIPRDLRSADPAIGELPRDLPAAGYARAFEPRTLRFPEDHGAHPGFRTEWWYFTGNLRAAGGRHFGFELTFFRYALAPVPAARSSAWATNQVYMAHFALTDTAGRQHSMLERFDRGALDLAGARARPFRVWLGDWEVASVGDAPFPLRLAAQGDAFGLELELDATKPAVEHGLDGWTPKGADAGNASYYYSFTRLAATGQVRVGNDLLAVAGQAWMDHEWGTSSLGAEIVGWDWFALQLDDGTELMFYRLRRASGVAAAWSAGSLIAPDGSHESLAPSDVRIDVRGHWTSSATGTTYPAGWRLELPGRGIVLDVTPRLANQEMALSVRYWEGAVAVSGRHHGRRLRGEGYVELTGYGDGAGDSR